VRVVRRKSSEWSGETDGEVLNSCMCCSKNYVARKRIRGISKCTVHSGSSCARTKVLEVMSTSICSCLNLFNPLVPEVFFFNFCNINQTLGKHPKVNTVEKNPVGLRGSRIPQHKLFGRFTLEVPSFANRRTPAGAPRSAPTLEQHGRPMEATKSDVVHNGPV
jgi:hypothetical protein